jgi:catechol 2,3-dioxygenase-like lactoylglutathione lyase family enzyme
MKQPKITGSRFVLAVKNLAKSSDFYQKQLGFKPLWSGEGWYFLGREKFVVMLGECANEPSAFETGDHSYFAYIDVENIDELHGEYSANQIEILSNITDKPWGMREFSIRTIDGHRIMFGQPTIHE